MSWLLISIVAALAQEAAPAALPGFVVTLEPGVDGARVARDHGVTPDFVYRRALSGFSGRISDAARQGLLRDARVVRVERDSVVQATETAYSWGIDRIDQRTRTLDGQYGVARTGAGVTAYIVDTGILTTHADFGGRASVGLDMFGEGGVDCNGHGTHVAGTVGGELFGVASAVDLVAVRVLDCSGFGSTSGVIAALDWVLADASGPSVVNMSLSGGTSAAMNDAVTKLTEAGLVVVVAAGNSSKDACSVSPAGAPAVLTIGATDKTDARSSYSNYGPCVDLFAPGTQILSDGNTSNTATATKSGTSMAAPHVAGVAALVLEDDPYAAPEDVADAIFAGATPGIVTNSLSPNPDLLFAEVGTGSTTPPPPGNAAPTASFAVACSDLTCSFDDTSSDADGSIVRWSWSFDDSGTSTERDPVHVFPSAGDWTVSLLVTDDEGATAATSATVTVDEPVVVPTIDLTATAAKVKGKNTTTLRWTGARGASVDVWRNGARIVTTPNDGEHVDVITARGGATYTYRVCEAGSTAVCGPDRTVTY